MVIMWRIGQSAVLLPNVVIVDNGGHSETERALVNYDGVAIRSLLKIQSTPLGNLWDIQWK